MTQTTVSDRTRKDRGTLHRAFALLALLLVATAPAHASENRTALIIGNADYQDSPLRNPGNDARDMADVLETIGFDVTLAVDVNRAEMGATIRKFGKKLRDRGGVGLFYYAGHGMQIDSRNYMIPIGTPMQEEDEVPYESVEVGSVLAKMESAGNALNVIILDACRNNPFPGRFRSTSRGLARVEAPIGSLIVYSTAPGSVADDGDGRNGVFTGHLLEQLRTPGLTLSQTVRRTRAAVVQDTNRAQVPWESSSLLTDIAFTQPLTAAVNKLLPESGVKDDSAQPLTTLPADDGFSALTVSVEPADARVRIMNIVEPYSPGMRLKSDRAYDVFVTHKDYNPWRRDVALSELDHRVDIELKPRPGTAAYIKSNPEQSKELSQQPTLPPLSSISAGDFNMGCSAGDRSCKKYEKPAVPQTLSGFRMGQTEVTVGQFRRFVVETQYVTDAERHAGGYAGCYVFSDSGGISRATSGWDWEAEADWRSPGFTQSDDHPVTCVSWNDAQAYVNWLTSSTGKAHRLPTEAEWEYAARAGSESRYQLGDSAGDLCRVGNGADRTVSPKGSRWSSRANCIDEHWFSAPVGSYSANEFGLHDMQGNVWEWVADTWSANHEGAMSGDRLQGQANLAGDRSQRVLRGGGWDGDERQQRLSARRLGSVESRTSMIGFRVVGGS